MSIKLDDLLNEKKGPAPVLDLLRTNLSSRADFESVLSKVPEYKVRPEKVREEEVTGEGEGGWRYHGGAREEPFPYADALPGPMRGLNMNDFYQVDIDWRMLTTARPKSRLEEEVFSRYVEMGRLQLARQRREEGKPQSWRSVKVMPGRGAVLEVRMAICEECEDELCAGRCADHLYSSYQRQDQQADSKEKEGGAASAADADDDEDNDKKKRKKSKRKKKKKASKKEDEHVSDN
ncbi:hypothetical protein FHG87_003186 [Trinorchestia longiramus]|nr:hypothetical protein FHG87_003186 [Trinorchestia longiramus]